MSQHEKAGFCNVREYVAKKRRPPGWTATHSAFTFSAGFHVALLLIVSLLYPGMVHEAAENLRFQIIMVSSDLIGQERSADSRETKDADEEQGEAATLPAPAMAQTSEKEETAPPPLPGLTYPTQAPLQREVRYDVTVDDEKPAPQEAPTLPDISQAYRRAPVQRSSASGTPEQSGSGNGGKLESTAADIYGTGGQGSGTGNAAGDGNGKKKVAAMAMDGCKLYILPPNDQPLTKEKALSLCEGITPPEEKRAVSIEMKVALGENGQPSGIQVTHSSGDKKLDSAVEDLMPLMRFETESLKDISSCYLTLIVICGDDIVKGSSKASSRSVSQ